MKKIFTLFTIMLASMMSFAAEPVAVTVAEATLGIGDFGSLTINGTSAAGHVVALELAGWSDTGAGQYEHGNMWGTINETAVLNDSVVAGAATPTDPMWVVTVAQEGTVVTVTTTLLDAAGNLYALSATGEEPKEEEKVYEPINILAYQMTVKANKYDPVIELKAKDDEKNLADIRLNTTSTSAFGDYGYAEGSSTCGIWSAVYNGVPLTLDKTANTARFYKEGKKICFEGVFYATDNEKQIYNIRMTTSETHMLTGTNLQKAEEDGTLLFLGSADEWSWMLELKITNYTGYGKYTNVEGIYVDENEVEWPVTGTGTYTYDEKKQSDIFDGKLLTEDRSKILIVELSYEAKEVVATPVVIENAVLTVTKSEILYIEGVWNDGTADHTMKFECMEGLMYDKEYAEVQLIMDGGPMQGGSFAQSTNAILTKDGNIATLTGTFKSNYDESIAYEVSISGAIPGVESAVENIYLNAAQGKTIENGQLIIIRDGVKFNANGTIID